MNSIKVITANLKFKIVYYKISYRFVLCSWGIRGTQNEKFRIRGMKELKELLPIHVLCSAFQKLYSKVQLDTLCYNHYPFHKSLNRHCRKIISTPSSGLLKEYNYNGIKWDVDIPRTGEKGKLTLTLVVAYSQVKGKCMFWVYI